MTEVDLPPFDGLEPCAACAYQRSPAEVCKVAYCDGGTDVRPCDLVFKGGEPFAHLHRTCNRCGYMWAVACVHLCAPLTVSEILAVRSVLREVFERPAAPAV